METLTSREHEILLALVQDEMDDAGEKNDDEKFKELAHVARKLGDGK